MIYRITSRKQFDEEMKDLQRHLKDAEASKVMGNIELMNDAINDANACTERMVQYLKGTK